MTRSYVNRIQDEMLPGECEGRRGYALKGQVCVSVDKQEEETCGRKKNMGKDTEERAEPRRSRRWNELRGETAAGG